NEFLTRLKRGKGEVMDIFIEDNKSISEFFSQINEEIEYRESKAPTPEYCINTDKQYTDEDIID
ncbi:hypothetical protein HK098_006875, partial [Nowakowskiella sp. JEL0407]